MGRIQCGLFRALTLQRKRATTCVLPELRRIGECSGAVKDVRASSPSYTASMTGSQAFISTKSSTAPGQDTLATQTHEDTAAKKRRNEEVKNITSFFNRRAPSPPTPRRKSDNDRLLQHCDRAVILSRTSSDPGSFFEAARELQEASRLFIKVVDSERSNGVDPEMDYEIFLLRSGWLQVTRTILALAGDGAAEICSLMMIDYLDWEIMLRKKGFRVKDGTEEAVDLKATESMSPKAREVMEEEYFHGPFVQDFAPVLHDIFWFMTVYRKKQSKAHVKRHIMPLRRYRSEQRCGIASTLWERMTNIPGRDWAKPMSLEWLRLCDRTEFKNGQELVAGCMLLHGDGLRGLHRVEQSLDIWTSGQKICRGGCESYSRTLMRQNISLIRELGFRPSEFRSSPKGGEVKNIALLYFQSVRQLASVLLHKGFIITTGFEPTLRSQELETSVRFILSVRALQRIKAKEMADDLREGTTEEEKNIEDAVRDTLRIADRWIHSWLQEQDVTKMPPLKRIETFNFIIARVLLMQNKERPDRTTILKLLQKLRDDPNLPSPDESTINAVMKAASQSGREDLVAEMLQFAHKRARRRTEIPSLVDHAERLQPESSTEPEPRAMDHNTVRSDDSGQDFTLKTLIDDALERGDIHRLISLMTICTRRPTRWAPAARASRDREGHFDSSGVPQYVAFSIQQFVFFLYPSLDVRRRRLALIEGHSGRVTKRGDEMNSTAFDTKVLLAAFNLIVASGLTGLGERMWRLLKRVHRRQNASDKTEGWTMPIEAYTILMRLYLTEVRVGSRWLRTRQHARETSPLSRSRETNSLRRSTDKGDALPRGWGYVWSGPLVTRLRHHEKPDRLVLARAIARSEYVQLKEAWQDKSAAAPDATFWRVFLSIFKKGGSFERPFEPSSDDELAFLKSLKTDVETFNRM